jgi:hypothetical protein
MYRSNRFGNKYVGVWDIYGKSFSDIQIKILKVISKHNDRLKKKYPYQYLSLQDLHSLFCIRQELLERIDPLILNHAIDNLVDDGWIKIVWVDDDYDNIPTYRLTNKSGLYPRFQRLDRKSISNTIMTNDFDGRNKIHPTINRGLSLREGARIQSFPDDFIFYGNFSDIVKQIGNAVPPLIAYKLGIHIIKLLGGEKISSIQSNITI